MMSLNLHSAHSAALQAIMLVDFEEKCDNRSRALASTARIESIHTLGRQSSIEFLLHGFIVL
jgi:hypothetical protein